MTPTTGPSGWGTCEGEAGAMGSLPDMRGPSTEPACRGHYTWAPAEPCLPGQARHTCGKQAGGETAGNGGACGGGQRITLLNAMPCISFFFLKILYRPIKQNETSKKLPLIKQTHTHHKKSHTPCNTSLLWSEGFPSFVKTLFSNPRRCSVE